MALAENTDVAVRLGRPLTVEETEFTPGLLDEASALVEGYCGRVFPVPPAVDVPAAVVVVVSKLVARALGSPSGQPEVTGSQYTAGPFQFSQNFAGEGSRMWIGSAERMMLKPYRISMRSVPLQSEQGGWVEGEL